MIQYDMWYKFEMDKTFLPIYIYSEQVDVLPSKSLLPLNVL